MRNILDHLPRCEPLAAIDRVVRGKKVTCLGASEPEITLAGGTYIDVKPDAGFVDSTRVSAKSWTELSAFMRNCLNVLGTHINHAL